MLPTQHCKYLTPINLRYKVWSKKFWEQVYENQKVYLIWILGDPPSKIIFLCSSAFMFRSLSGSPIVSPLLCSRSAFRIWNYAFFSSVDDLPHEIPKFLFTLFRLQGAQIGLTLRDIEIALTLESARTYPRRWPWMWDQSNLKEASF